MKLVDNNTPVEWCSPVIITLKKDGSPRHTIDLQKLNSQTARETHHWESPFQLGSQILPHTKNTIINAVDEYHAIPLDQESQKLTSFITDWGRYMNFWMPQGFKAAEDIYTKRYRNIINTVSNKNKIVDDTLLYNYNIEESFFATWDFLTLMANNGIVANANKFQFCQETVAFAGLIVTSTGVAPSHKTLAAIQNFPTSQFLVHGLVM